MKILILSGDKVKKVIDPKNEFVFIILGDNIFYVDSTIGKMWLTDAKTLENLGEGHKKAVRKHLK